MIEKYNSKLSKKYGSMLFIFPYFLISNPSMSNEEKYMKTIFKKQYDDFVGIGGFLAILIMFILFLFNITSFYMLLLTLIPFFLYDVWFFIEFLFKRDMKEISFVRQANDLGSDWILPCIERRHYSSLSWLKYINKK